MTKRNGPAPALPVSCGRRWKPCAISNKLAICYSRVF